MAVLRQVVGDTLRAVRLRQQRTLREVSSTARVSLGYLSEVERGQKEPSSELLAAICGALDVELSELFAEVTDTLRREEKLVGAGPVLTTGAALSAPAVIPHLPHPAPTSVSAGNADAPARLRPVRPHSTVAA